MDDVTHPFYREPVAHDAARPLRFIGDKRYLVRTCPDCGHIERDEVRLLIDAGRLGDRTADQVGEALGCGNWKCLGTPVVTLQ